MGVFSWGLNIEFETAMVNEPSVFEPLKFYCNDATEQKPYKITPRQKLHLSVAHGHFAGIL